MKINSAKDLGALVRAHRKKKKWSQQELASRAGVRRLWISQFERGKTTAHIGLVIQTLKALNLSLSIDDSKATVGKATVVDLDTVIYPQPDELVGESGTPLDSTLRDHTEK